MKIASRMTGCERKSTYKRDSERKIKIEREEEVKVRKEKRFT